MMIRFKRHTSSHLPLKSLTRTHKIFLFFHSLYALALLSFFFFFFENELILQSKAEDTKGKPAKQEREAYHIEQLDLKKGG